MDVIRLRTMSRKSIFSNGQQKGLSVQNLLDLKKYSYIAYCYYNYSSISFLTDVLDACYIHENLRIEKPGTNKEMYDRWDASIKSIFDRDMFFKIKSHYKKSRKKYLLRTEKCRKFTETKGFLQAKNQGHFKK